MINEYLFLTNDDRANVEAYKPGDVVVEISNIENTPLWVAKYSVPEKNEDSAKKLSDVHISIMKYSPLVLSCESSEYYNRTLFPLINELERKLRKLLYLAASISDNEKAKGSIKLLEEKDFGVIFELLFVDENFVSDMKMRINADNKSKFNGKSKYSKAEIQEYIDSLTERTLWDTILSKRDAPTLRNRFRDVKDYRNNVMHAHNISKEIFGKARYLFNKVNVELDTAIGRILGYVEGGFATEKPEVNTAISTAMAAKDLSDISSALNDIAAPTAALSQLSQTLKELQPLTAGVALADAFNGIQIPTISPALTAALKEYIELVEVLKREWDFSTLPAMEGLNILAARTAEIMKPYREFQNSLKSTNELLPDEGPADKNNAAKQDENAQEEEPQDGKNEV